MSTVDCSSQITTDAQATAPFTPALPWGHTTGQLRVAATDPATSAEIGAGTLAVDVTGDPNSRLWRVDSPATPLTLAEGLTVTLQHDVDGIKLAVATTGPVIVAATLHGDCTAIPLIEDGGGAPSGRRH